MEFSWLHAAIIAAATIVGVGSTYIFKMKPDNPVEEVAEAVIKQETGVVVDLSPDSDDNKK